MMGLHSHQWASWLAHCQELCALQLTSGIMVWINTRTMIDTPTYWYQAGLKSLNEPPKMIWLQVGGGRSGAVFIGKGGRCAALQAINFFNKGKL